MQKVKIIKKGATPRPAPETPRNERETARTAAKNVSNWIDETARARETKRRADLLLFGI